MRGFLIGTLTMTIVNSVCWTSTAAILPPTGLQAHYRSDAGVSIGGGGITSWADQASLNGLNNAASSGGTEPQTSSSTIGYHASFPTVSFTAGDHFDFVLPNADLFAGTSIFAVVNTGAGQDSFETVVSTGGISGSGGVRWAAGVGSAGTQGYGWAGPTSAVNLGNGSSISTDTWHVVSWVYDKTNWIVRNEYPSTVAVTTVADTSFFTGDWNGVLGSEAGTATYALTGEVAEVLIYDRAVMGTDYDDVLAYFNDRFFVEPPPAVPEPSSLLLLGLGALGLARHTRRRRRREN